VVFPVIQQALEIVLSGGSIGREEALELCNLPQEAMLDLLVAAHRIRLAYKGTAVELCSIVNAKSGRCTENCAFCAQSAHHHTAVDVYPLLPAEELIRRARSAAVSGVHRFGIVTSGTRISLLEEWREILRAVEVIATEGKSGLTLPLASSRQNRPESSKKPGFVCTITTWKQRRVSFAKSVPPTTLPRT